MRHKHYLIGKDLAKDRERIRSKCLAYIIDAVNRWKKSNKGVPDAERCISDIEEYISEMEFDLQENNMV